MDESLDYAYSNNFRLYNGRYLDCTADVLLLAVLLCTGSTISFSCNVDRETSNSHHIKRQKRQQQHLLRCRQLGGSSRRYPSPAHGNEYARTGSFLK